MTNEGQQLDRLPSTTRGELLGLRQVHHALRAEGERLRHSLPQADPRARFAFVEHEKGNHSVTALCRLLGVSPSGYWAWRTRAPSARVRADQELAERIVALYEASQGTYGAPRIHAALAASGIRCSRKRVARVMREQGLVGRSAG